MKNSLKFLLLLLLPLAVQSQSKVFLSKIDTSARAKNPYITQYDLSSFFESALADVEYDIFNPDIQLLNATVFFTINRFRQGKSLPLYQYSPELEAIAFNYVDYKSRNRLEQSKSNYERIAKDFPNIARYFDFRGKLLNFNTALVNAVNYTRNKSFYYDRKNNNPGLKLYYVNKDNNNQEKEPIPYYTYTEFANMLLNHLRVNEGVKNPKSKAYEYIGCYISVDAKTLHRRKIPLAKVMVVYGGYRMKNIEQ